MGTISTAFGVISGALTADQSGLSIIAGNVANANTPGYTREVPTWQENIPVTINGVAYGTGVTETGATSLRDRVLLERLDQQQQLASASSARLDALNNVQALFTQRHHRLLQRFFLTGSRPRRQRTPPAGAVRGLHTLC
jgi:flagellar hook-associated protein 1 FlgK